MYYVYLIQSIKDPSKNYVGSTTDLTQRMEKHNSGASIYTSNFKPWKLITAICFNEKSKALAFEKYLKVGSGHAFAKKHFW